MFRPKGVSFEVLYNNYLRRGFYPLIATIMAHDDTLDVQRKTDGHGRRKDLQLGEVIIQKETTDTNSS